MDQTKRFLHSRLVDVGSRGISVRSVGGNRAGEVRFGRFLRNKKVTVKKIIEKAQKTTSRSVEGLHILAVQDTTSFRDDGSGNSIVGHATVCSGGRTGDVARSG